MDRRKKLDTKSLPRSSEPSLVFCCVTLRPYSASANYGNWELSSDRANAARRLMQANGVRADQVTQVRGFADQ